MNFKNIIDMIHFELLLESMGFLFGLALLWNFFFQQKLSFLLSLFITSIC